jgi:hypothetical protein
MTGEEDLSKKRKFRREIEVEKNTVTKVSDVMTRIYLPDTLVNFAMKEL